MRRLISATLFLLATALVPAAPPEYQVLAPQGIPVEFAFRSLQPGEAVLAELKDSSLLKQVTIQINDRSYVLNGKETGKKSFAIIGLDVDLKPQPLSVGLRAAKPDGTEQSYQEELLIEPKEFQKRSFRISEEMLVPPPAEQERVKREQELVAAVYDVITPEWLGTGSFLAPLSDREAFSNFGQRRIYNKLHTSVHQGVDIPAPWGTPIRASNSGRVVLASHLYLSGITVIIDHGRGVFSIYCHLSKPLVKRGESIARGAILGKVGNTGRSTGPHLHWGIRIFDSRVDPFSLVSLPLE